MEEIEAYMSNNHIETLANVLERIIKFEFPLIKNLKVHPLIPKGSKIRISFEDERYSQKEVMKVVDFYKQKTRKLKEL